MTLSVSLRQCGLDVEVLRAFIRRICQQGGPRRSEYSELSGWFAQVNQARKGGHLGKDALLELRLAFGEAMGALTMQGRSLLQKHGYAGDFEIIDEIYREVVSDVPELRRWDQFYHAQGAPKAVRNRKEFFKSLVKETLHLHRGRPIEVLNVASGPCRDVAEFFDANPRAPVRFTCVDLDPSAIAYAQLVCERWLDRITFIQSNALRLRIESRFDLVWSAGLFDYFDDRGFVFLLSRLLNWTKPGAHAVVGNFVEPNPSAAYQEFGDWVLQYRTTQRLLELGVEAGLQREAMDVSSETEGINLFLKMRTRADG